MVQCRRSSAQDACAPKRFDAEFARRAAVGLRAKSTLPHQCHLEKFARSRGNMTIAAVQNRSEGAENVTGPGPNNPTTSLHEASARD